AGDAAGGRTLGEWSNDAIRVLIVDDHGLFRRGLEATLQLEPDIEVVGEAGGGGGWGGEGAGGGGGGGVVGGGGDGRGGLRGGGAVSRRVRRSSRRCRARGS